MKALTTTAYTVALVLALALCAAVPTTNAQHAGNTVDSSIPTNSALGRRILAQAVSADTGARWLADQDNGGDYSFIADYAIKFQGCHHVQQWNDDNDEENDVKIMTKRLARFRLCPVDQCSHDKSAGCTSKFGDYVVDMATFVEAYLTALDEDGDAQADVCGSVSFGLRGSVRRQRRRVVPGELFWHVPFGKLLRVLLRQRQRRSGRPKRTNRRGRVRGVCGI